MSAGWWWPHRDFVMVRNRPNAINRDDQGRLHSVAGPAIRWRDGWALYFVHGIRVPTTVVESPETLTIHDIQGEQNVEVRRVMIERFGHERYIRESGAKLVHRDDWGTLWHAEVPGDEPLVMVEVVNATPEPGTVDVFKTYFLRVPPTMRRAKEAVAWSFGMTENEYDPVIQT